MPHAPYVLSLAALLAVVACSDATAPVERLSVTIAAETLGSGGDSDVPVTASGRLHSLLISGGGGLSCGVQSASALATRRGTHLEVKLQFQPLDSCPFGPSTVHFDAIVAAIPPGWYDLQVTQEYWRDQPVAIVLRERVLVAGH
jgi:hypothetical protein